MGERNGAFFETAPSNTARPSPSLFIHRCRVPVVADMVRRLLLRNFPLPVFVKDLFGCHESSVAVM